MIDMYDVIKGHFSSFDDDKLSYAKKLMAVLCECGQTRTDGFTTEINAMYERVYADSVIMGN